jgi:protein transport protein SEC61 subunit gamma-like protein
MDLSSYWVRFKSFLGECLRVLRVTRKPSKIEFNTIVKVSGLGMIIIGLIGFVITMLRELLFP